MISLLNKFPLRHVTIDSTKLLMTNLTKSIGLIIEDTSQLKRHTMGRQDTVYSISWDYYQTPDYWWILMIVNNMVSFKESPPTISNLTSDNDKVAYYIKSDGTKTTLLSIKRLHNVGRLSDYDIIKQYNLTAVSQSMDTMNRELAKYQSELLLPSLEDCISIDNEVTNRLSLINSSSK